MPTALSAPAPRAKTKGEVTGRQVLLYLVLFFGVVFGANAIMIHYAVTTFGGVETESSYKAGLNFRLEEEAAARQTALGWTVDAKVARQAGQDAVIEVRPVDKQGRAVQGLLVSMKLGHATDARHDHKAEALEVEPGVYRVVVADVASGQWQLLLDLAQGGERVFRSKSKIRLL